jgi:CelD/BcsL family acetyltransferase involved in cellulose biosynthesis
LNSGGDGSYELIESWNELRGEWTELAQRSGNIFSTWEFVSVWLRHFGADKEPVVVAYRGGDGGLLGVIPLYRASVRGVRTLRFMGHGAGDELGPVCAPADRRHLAAALRRFLESELRRWDVFVGEQLAAGTSFTWSAALGGARVAQVSSPLIRIDGTRWDDFLASRSANFRQQVRRRERNLFKHHQARYRLLTGPDGLQHGLDVLFRLHRARWGKEFSLFSEQEAFHREFAEVAQERGWLRLWFLELDDTPVAAWYGFRFCGADCYYQAGRDPAADREASAFVLFSHTIREAMADGMAEYRLLRGDERYKYRFATDDVVLETVAVGRRALGRALVAASAPLVRWPPAKAAAKAIFGE